MGVKKFFGKVVDYVKEYKWLVFVQASGIFSLLTYWLSGDTDWLIFATIFSVFTAEERIMIYLKSLTEVLLSIEEVVDDEKN